MLSALFLLLADHACRRPRAADGAGSFRSVAVLRPTSATEVIAPPPFVTKQQFLVAETQGRQGHAVGRRQAESLSAVDGP